MDRDPKMAATSEDQSVLDRMLAEELNQMSLHERERVYEEIHGVNEIVKETPDFVTERLSLLEKALGAIRHKDAYDQALQEDPLYCCNPKFRIMFLRVEYFDPEKAAARMVHFFEGKRSYFPQALTRDVRISDLDKDDLQCLKSGHLQILSSRDQSGRAVFCDFQAAFPKAYNVSRNMVKCFVYFMLCMAEDEENQKLGIVGLLYHVGEEMNKPDPKLMKEGPATISWIPIRFTGIHVCVNERMSSILARLLLLGGGSAFRARSRVYYGTHTECRYKLMTFGVPVSVFPITDEGDLKTIEMMKWIRRRMVKDEACQRGLPWRKIDLPCKKDVLVGKGAPFQRHPGNVNLRHLCELRLDAYKSAKKGSKSLQALEVIRECGDFLKRDQDGWWTPVDAETVKTKVIKAFLSAQSTVETQRKAGDESVQARTSPEMQLSANPTVFSSSRSLEQDSKRARVTV